MIQNALNGWDLESLDFVFIENVSSLVYPSSSDFRRRPAFRAAFGNCGRAQAPKYLTMFNSANAVIITKSDLADAVECDGAAAERNIQAVRPGLEVSRPSAKTGEDIKVFLEFLENWRRRSRAAAAV
jgi:hydrogenase nickel incorporation protein HypB